MPDARFYFMHFMPYPALPADYDDRSKYPSSWVELPNAFYDPATGTELYRRYIGELVLADRLGFDGVVVNEHHSTTFSMMAAPNLIASILARETETAKICVWGTPPTLVYPNRLAEEYAMIDVMSGGRLEVAFPLGTGMEYWANPINPTTARERHKESIEIILQAWTQDGPTKYDGEFYNYRFLNPWPRPYQKPHPPCYIVGTGSPETIELAAQLGFGYSAVFITRKRAVELNNSLRERAAHYGKTIGSEQFPVLTMAYVAETQEKAEQEYTEHLRFFFEDALRTTPQYLAPPGYLSVEQLKIRAQMADKMHGSFDFKNIEDAMFVAVGTPEKVANQLGEWSEMMGSRHFNLTMHLGSMPHWKTVKNATLFAEEVMPRLRSSKPASQRAAAE